MVLSKTLQSSALVTYFYNTDYEIIFNKLHVTKLYFITCRLRYIRNMPVK